MILTVAQARDYYENDAAHDFDHVLRVLGNARQIARTTSEPVNTAVLETAVLLHDIARADQDRTGVDHAAAGARRAETILANHPADFVAAVSEAIASHRFRVERPPQSIEAKILYDADKLDSIGAVGVARVFAYAGAHGNRLWAEDGDGDHTPLQEYRGKLLKLKDKLITPAARQIAQARHAYMIDFFERMAAEVTGKA